VVGIAMEAAANHKNYINNGYAQTSLFFNLVIGVIAFMQPV
jgi:hypothetical protein